MGTNLSPRQSGSKSGWLDRRRSCFAGTQGVNSGIRDGYWGKVIPKRSLHSHRLQKIPHADLLYQSVRIPQTMVGLYGFKPSVRTAVGWLQYAIGLGFHYPRLFPALS